MLDWYSNIIFLYVYIHMCMYVFMTFAPQLQISCSKSRILHSSETATFSKMCAADEIPFDESTCSSDGS